MDALFDDDLFDDDLFGDGPDTLILISEGGKRISLGRNNRLLPEDDILISLLVKYIEIRESNYVN
jgi:hypothetical protein